MFCLCVCTSLITVAEFVNQTYCVPGPLIFGNIVLSLNILDLSGSLV